MMKKVNFKEEARKVHGDKYDYSKVDYINNKTKVCIICPEHGEFWQTPQHHLRGQKCPLCAKIARSDKNRKSNNDFKEEARKIHGDKYDYSKVDYRRSDVKVCIICPIHGEFYQIPKNHLKGQGCPKCSGRFHTDTEYFIEKAKKIHGDKYDYSKVEYTNNKTKVCIICPEHGEFWQTPQEHLQNKGCRKCGIENMKKAKSNDTETFINKAKQVHKDKFLYDETEYVNSLTKVKIICPIHGEFKQLPYVHLDGFGCSKCSGKYRYTTDEFIEKLKEVHGDKYDYSKVEYTNSHNKITIICPIHGEFEQMAYEHLQGKGCSKCSHIQSNAEIEVNNFVKSLGFQTLEKDRTILNGKELDIYIPFKKVAIEYDGLIWHSDKFQKNKNFHLEKTELCEKHGIRLIHIFENEWINNRKIVEMKLKQILGCNKDLPKIFGRKCCVKEINNVISRNFLDKNHIQGFASGTIHLGCFYNNELIGVMSFKKERNGSDKWELTRFATDINKHCVGVGGKLFKYFIRNYNPSEVKSFADRRWSVNNDNLYIKLGFKLRDITKPDYYYTNSKLSLIHKFNFRKKRINSKYGLSLMLTEREMTQKLGYYRIYNCGLYKYVWINKRK